MPQSPTICLIHGHGVDATIWDGLYTDLQSAGPVLNLDFSRQTNCTTLEAYADDLYVRLQTARVEKALLVGHSMGGYMAMAFAQRYPEQVHGLVLYHSTPTADDEARKEQRRQIIEKLKIGGSGPFIEKQLPKMVAPTYPVAETQALIDRFRHVPADALMAGMRAIASRPDRTQVLRDAQFPVLLVLGREDQLIPYDKTAQLASLSRRVSLVTIEQAGHLSMLEQPQASLKALQSFVAQS